MKNFAIFLFTTVVFFSCRATMPNKNNLAYYLPLDRVGINPMPVTLTMPVNKQDTIKKKQITTKDFNALVNGAYKYNFDNLLAPKFDQLLMAHKAQTESNKMLSDYMVETRRRLDSIVRERNYYRANDVKARQQALAYQKQAIQFQQDIIKMQKEAYAKNDNQIFWNTVMAITGLVGVGLIFFGYIGLFMRVRTIDKKIDSVIKTMPNA